MHRSSVVFERGTTTTSSILTSTSTSTFTPSIHTPTPTPTPTGTISTTTTTHTIGHLEQDTATSTTASSNDIVVRGYSFGKHRIRHYFCAVCASSLMAESVQRGVHEGVMALNVSISLHHIPPSFNSSYTSIVQLHHILQSTTDLERKETKTCIPTSSQVRMFHHVNLAALKIKHLNGKTL